MLSKTFINQMKARLLEDEKRLKNELASMTEPDLQHPGQVRPTYPESKGDSMDDNAAEETQFFDAVGIVNRLEKELSDTEKALQTIEQGKYGVCKYCKKAIDQKRLEARPTSTSCIACKKTLTQEL